MSAYDALLGTISQDGVPVELGNGLNITGGLTVTPNPATGKLDISGAGIAGDGGACKPWMASAPTQSRVMCC